MEISQRCVWCYAAVIEFQRQASEFQSSARGWQSTLGGNQSPMRRRLAATIEFQWPASEFQSAVGDFHRTAGEIQSVVGDFHRTAGEIQSAVSGGQPAVNVGPLPPRGSPSPPESGRAAGSERGWVARGGVGEFWRKPRKFPVATDPGLAAGAPGRHQAAPAVVITGRYGNWPPAARTHPARG